MPDIIYNDASVQAEYADGFIIDETKNNDQSIYEDGRNTFFDILNRKAVTEHGKMVRFTLFYKNTRYDVDWRNMPDTARPIRYKKMEMDYNGINANIQRLMTVGFGYQYNDDKGNNIEVKEEY
jgi:putative lipase involved disintegration of autophagic bodies